MQPIYITSPIDGSIFEAGHIVPSEAAMEALEKAKVAFPAWCRSSKEERAQLVLNLSDALIARKDALAEAVIKSIGRPESQADESARFKAVTLSQIEALNAIGEEQYTSDESVARFTRRTGQGVHLSIAPWNYPVGLLPWLIITPILAGNPVILKHAAQTVEVGRIVREAYESIGGPEGVLQVLELSHDQVEQLIQTGNVKGVNFIGSVQGGLSVHQAAAGTLTHVHLELGGKDPTYVRSDANLDLAIAEIAEGCFSNAGQSCCSVERIYVHEDVKERFIEEFKKEMEIYKLGSPYDPEATVGPVVKKSAAEFIRNQVADAVAKGADAYEAPVLNIQASDTSCYVAPTLLTGVNGAMNVMQEETFGPLACMQVVSSDDEAIELMNESEFGLTASVWTQDIETGKAICDKLDAGTVFVNRCDHADLYLPWGGQKMSGLGRGNGKEGLLGVMDLKSFHVRKA